MARPLVTKGDIERAIAAAISVGGLRPGELEVRVRGTEIRVLPCKPSESQSDEPNPWESVAFT